MIGYTLNPHFCATDSKWGPPWQVILQIPAWEMYPSRVGRMSWLCHLPSGPVQHSSDEPGELSQWLCRDNSTVNVVTFIIIIITVVIVVNNKPAACRLCLSGLIATVAVGLLTLSSKDASSRALASPAMGHWGTCPPRLPDSYFGDHSLYRLWRVTRTVFCPVERFLAFS